MASIIRRMIYGVAGLALAAFLAGVAGVGTGVCFSTRLAMTHSASFVESFLSLLTSAAARRENYVVVTAK